MPDDEGFAQLIDTLITKGDDLTKVMAGIDMHQGKRKTRRAEGLLGQAQQYDGIFTAREQEHRTFALGGHLSQNINGFRLQPVQMCTRRNIAHVHILFSFSLSSHADRIPGIVFVPTTSVQTRSAEYTS